MTTIRSTAQFIVNEVNRSLADRAIDFLRKSAAAETENRLLDVFFGIKLSMKFLERFTFHVPLESYVERYGEEAVRERRFYNIGAGDIWHHPAWTAMDISLVSDAAGLRCDLRERQPFPAADGTAKLVYSSHCIEHLSDAVVTHVLAESFRILEPGALIRIAVPDMDLYHRAYVRGDNDYFININPNSGQNSDHSLAQNFVSQFAYPCSTVCEATPELHMGDDEVSALFETHAFEEALDICVGRIPADLHLDEHPHINWFNERKLGRMLDAAGFSETRRSAYGQSDEMVLCDVASFDYMAPEITLFMEARKPR